MIGIVRTHSLYLGTAVAALLAGPAFAQDTPAAAPAPQADAATQAQDSGDIVVTARRREETLRNVPIAVTAFTADKLIKSGAMSIAERAAIVGRPAAIDSSAASGRISA